MESDGPLQLSNPGGYPTVLPCVSNRLLFAQNSINWRWDVNVHTIGLWITVDSIGTIYLLVAVSNIILFTELQYESRRPVLVYLQGKCRLVLS
jgi:hypothetical protein